MVNYATKSRFGRVIVATTLAAFTGLYCPGKPVAAHLRYVSPDLCALFYNKNEDDEHSPDDYDESFTTKLSLWLAGGSIVNVISHLPPNRLVSTPDFDFGGPNRTWHTVHIRTITQTLLDNLKISSQGNPGKVPPCTNGCKISQKQLLQLLRPSTG